MTFDFFEIFLLSAIQGISEFIPVSSSAHLFLVSDIYNFKIQSLLTDIGLHLGSLLAIITYFHSDLSNILKNKNLLLLMIFGSAPVIIVGAILYQTNLISYLRNIEIIAWTTLIFGVLLYFSDKNKNRFENVNQLEKVNESYLPNYLVENYEKYKSLLD
mgnify:CR=1 FL=1